MMDFLAEFDGSGRTPRDLQVSLLQSLSNKWDDAPAHALVASTGCHGAGTEVLLFDGTKRKIEDVQVGDVLMGPDSAPRHVLALHRGSEMMYKITNTKRDSYVCSGSHTLCLRYTTGTKKPKIDGTFLEVTVNEYLTFSKHRKHILKGYYTEKLQFPYIPTPIDPYFLGAWLGDGSSGGTAITTMDTEIIDMFKSYAARFEGMHVRVNRKPGNKAATYHMARKKGQGNPVLKLMQELNVINNKHVPQIYLHNTEDVRKQVLAGLLDTDGYAFNKCYEITTKYEQLAKDIEFLARSLGLRTHTRIKIATIKSRGFSAPYFRITITGLTENFLPMRVKHKLTKSDGITPNKNTRFFGFSVEPLGVGEYYGVTVDSDHLYVLGNFIVTHNCGKSAISRAIQKQTDAAVITANNLLVTQFANEYKINRFYGADHYNNHGTYDEAKLLACDPENHSVYNACSFRIAQRQKDFRQPSVIVVDESQSALSLLCELTTLTLSIKRPQWLKSSSTSPERVIQFLLHTIAETNLRAKAMAAKNRKMEVKRLENRVVKLEDLVDALKNEPERYAIWTTCKHCAFGTRYYLHIKPTSLPKSFVDSFFKDSKIILLSATVLQSDVLELLGGRKYCKIEAGSSVPVERRRIYIQPTESVLSYPMPHKEVAERLDEILDNIPYRPALIHVTYGDMAAIADNMKTPVLVHDKETKKEVLADWLKNGGVLMGAGMAEGLDLKDDLCRLNIITKCAFPNLGDDYVNKKLALPGGKRWYALQAMKTLIQATGRAVRSDKDFAVTIVLDGRVSKLYNQVRDEVPESFREALVWDIVSYDEIKNRISRLGEEDA